MDHLMVLLSVVILGHSVVGQGDGKEDSIGNKDWMLIFGYVCFAIGAVLIIFGFARLIWWAWLVKKQTSSRPPREAHPNFYTYYKDPWLRAPSMASMASHSKDLDEESLHVDTDAIYAQPIDANPRGIYLTSASPTEQELSQTESQIYAEGANGSGSGRGQGIHDFDDDPNVIYSVPYRETDKDIPVTSLDGADGDAPALPKRGYGNQPRLTRYEEDSISLTEADRSSVREMREIGYVEPPTDYSPERRPRDRGAHTNPAFSAEDIRSNHVHSVKRRQAASSRDSHIRELSGGKLYQSAVFKDRYGNEIPNHSRIPVGAGSVKSMKSLYKYMDTDEPCALDREMEYTFVSSFH